MAVTTGYACMMKANTGSFIILNDYYLPDHMIRNFYAWLPHPNPSSSVNYLFPCIFVYKTDAGSKYINSDRPIDFMIKNESPSDQN